MGGKLAQVVVPQEKIGLATVCNIMVNGCLLKAGVPTDSKFGGTLQIGNYNPLPLVELIQCSGSSPDPSPMLIATKMISVGQVAMREVILASFREIPAICQTVAQNVITRLREADLGGLLTMGEVGKSVCEVPVHSNKLGTMFVDGSNPVAAAVEFGVEVENYATSTVTEYRKLVKCWEL